MEQIEFQQFIPQATQDGSYTFFSDEFQEAFHSYYGAKKEAEIKFVEPTRIKQIAKNNNFIKILDICYGLGYNSAAAMEAIWDINPQCHIELVALEISAAVPTQAIACGLMSHWRFPIPQLLTELTQTYTVSRKFFQGTLLLGDARNTIRQICQQSWQAHAIFLDPFSPPKCPQLWTVEFIACLGKCLEPSGRLATYSCAAAVRTALMLAGLKIGSTEGMGRKSPGTVASFCDRDLRPISLQEREHLQTRAAIPYQDFHLRDSAEAIHNLRQQKQQDSTLESTSQWKKRWLMLHNQQT